MQDDERSTEMPTQHARLIDLAYLFGSAPAGVRHNPHVRQQPVCTEMDWIAASLLIRSRVAGR